MARLYAHGSVVKEGFTYFGATARLMSDGCILIKRKGRPSKWNVWRAQGTHSTVSARGEECFNHATTDEEGVPYFQPTN